MPICITILLLTEKNYSNDDDVTFVGVCTKQTCFLTSGKQDM